MTHRRRRPLDFFPRASPRPGRRRLVPVSIPARSPRRGVRASTCQQVRVQIGKAVRCFCSPPTPTYGPPICRPVRAFPACAPEASAQVGWTDGVCCKPAPSWRVDAGLRVDELDPWLLHKERWSASSPRLVPARAQMESDASSRHPARIRCRRGLRSRPRRRARGRTGHRR